jgi:hypothetical protein
MIFIFTSFPMPVNLTNSLFPGYRRLSLASAKRLKAIQPASFYNFNLFEKFRRIPARTFDTEDKADDRFLGQDYLL